MRSMFFSCVCSRLLAGASLLLLSSSPLFAAEYVSVKNDGVNVRTGPGTDHQIAMELFAGYPLQVVEKQGDWLKIVDFEKDTGWIYASLVENGNTVIINAASNVNMRAEPTTSSQVIASVERGVVMTRLERKGEWSKLRHASGTVGWIHNSLLWP